MPMHVVISIAPEQLVEAVTRASRFTGGYLINAHPVSFANGLLTIGFDPEFDKPSFDQVMISQGRAAHLGQALVHADAGLSPTRWQASTYPPVLRDRIEVIFDGVNTQVMKPDPAATVTLPNGHVLKAGDEVLTFVNRNLEPYRGYHTFIRALPHVLAERPEAQVVIVGGDDVSYGRKPADGQSWKELFLSQVRDRLDLGRVHFLGKVPYPTFVSLMQVSRVHAYLTYPFVLSWSMLEAMAAGCYVIGSRTAPVQELIEDGGEWPSGGFLRCRGLGQDDHPRPRLAGPLCRSADEGARDDPQRL